MNAQKIRFAVRLCTGGLLGSTRPVGAVSKNNLTAVYSEVNRRQRNPMPQIGGLPHRMGSLPLKAIEAFRHTNHLCLIQTRVSSPALLNCTGYRLPPRFITTPSNTSARAARLTDWSKL